LADEHPSLGVDFFPCGAHDAMVTIFDPKLFLRVLIYAVNNRHKLTRPPSHKNMGQSKAEVGVL
tara:strand:+ start:108 stop:299 length:192 start_codon:yes stop_codon:yes gene_type:complete